MKFHSQSHRLPIAPVILWKYTCVNENEFIQMEFLQNLQQFLLTLKRHRLHRQLYDQTAI